MAQESVGTKLHAERALDRANDRRVADLMNWRRDVASEFGPVFTGREISDQSTDGAASPIPLVGGVRDDRGVESVGVH